jgi:hypothetical protein
MGLEQQFSDGFYDYLGEFFKLDVDGFPVEV